MKLKHWGLMFLLMLVCAIVLILIAFCIEGLRTVDGLKYTLSSDGQSYYVSGYFKYLQPKKVVVRSDYKGLPVTGIGEKAFYSNNPYIGHHRLTEITIPSSITSIGKWAFWDCYNLQKVTFEGNSQLQDIGNSAFSGCSNLASVYYGGTIADWCGIEFHSNPMEYASNFYIKQGDDWQEMTDIVIPSRVTSIANLAFSGFDNLKSVTFADDSQLQSIGENAFSSCINLASITIPSKIASIGGYAFSGCSNLASVYYGGTIADWCSIEFHSSIMDYVSNFYIKQGDDWQRMTDMTDIVIPSRVTSLANYAFSGFDNLKSVTFEADSQLKSIGEYAFYNCSSLTSITIPSSVTSIWGNTFANCDNLQTVYYGGSKAQWEEIYIGSGNDNLENAKHYYLG